MPSRKEKQVPTPAPARGGYFTISDCSFIQQAAATNEHTAAAVVALANALTAQAVATEAVAKALAASGGTFNGPALNISGS